MTKAQPSAKQDDVDPRLLYERMKSALELGELRIKEHDRRMEATSKHVDERSQLFGLQLKWGVPIGLVLLFIALYFSMSPMVKSAVEAAASKIDFDKKIAAATDTSLKHQLTADLISKSVDSGAIQKAAASVVASPEFTATIRTQAEKAAREAVKATVDQMVADTNHFRAIVDEQLRADRDRISAAAATAIELKAENQDELQRRLLETILSFEKLGTTWRSIEVYPFDDSLMVKVRLWWRPEQAKEERLMLYTFTFENLTATTEERKSRVAVYVNEPSVPASIGIIRQSSNSNKFVAGQSSSNAAGRFATFRDAAEYSSKAIVDLVQDCFGINYPVTWRVRTSE